MKSLRRLDYLFALLLFLLTTAALLTGSRTQGYTRDEGYYFVAAENHARYYEDAAKSLVSTPWHPWEAIAGRAAIERGFGYNNEHPPLMKTLFGLSWRVLHRCNCPNEAGLHPIPYATRHKTLGLLGQSEAMRLPSHVLAGLLVLGVYLFGARAWGRFAGLVAAGLTIFLPRHFFHAQLACFDAPVAALIFLATWAYWRAQATGRRGARIALGVLLGLGLAAKHNMFFLPLVLEVHSLWAGRAVLRAGLMRPGVFAKLGALLRWIFAPWVLPAAVISVIVYLSLWPWLWPDPVHRFAAYVGFHLHHVHYNIEYLGQNYNRPPYPWHYVPVMTLLTTPVTTLSLALVGAVALTLFRRQRPATSEPSLGGKAAGGAGVSAVSETALTELAAGTPGISGPVPAGDGAPGLLVFLGVLWPMLVIMRPGTPIFGAEKHWLPAMPFVALLAGAGFSRMVGAVSKDWPLFAARAFGLFAAAAVLLGPLLETRRAHPYALSHYNAIAGGPQGGADLGMNRQFWGYAVRGALPFLNEHVRPGAPIYFHDFNGYQLQMSQKDGFARRDLADAGMEEPGVRGSDFGLVIHERHFNKYEYWLWDAYGTTRPSHLVLHEGVPVVTVYARPAAPQLPPPVTPPPPPPEPPAAAPAVAPDAPPAAEPVAPAGAAAAAAPAPPAAPKPAQPRRSRGPRRPVLPAPAENAS